AMAWLGINTALVWGWPGGTWVDEAEARIPAHQINDALNACGLTSRSQAIYSPPAYFDFDLIDSEGNLSNALTQLIEEQWNFTPAQNGGSTYDVVKIQLSDEPAWFLP